MSCEHSLNDSLGYNIYLTAQASRNLFGKLIKPYGVAPEQMALIKTLKENPNITQTKLAEFVSKDKTTVKRLLENLIKNDFITKEISREDRRHQILNITQKSEKLIEDINPIILSLLSDFQQIFTENEYKQFLDLLKRYKKFCISKESTL